jgi:hypothetical protein
MVWSGFIRLRIGTSGGLLWTWLRIFGFHKRRKVSWLQEWLLASQERICSIEWVNDLVILYRSTMFYIYICPLIQRLLVDWTYFKIHKVVKFRLHQCSHSQCCNLI